MDKPITTMYENTVVFDVSSTGIWTYSPSYLKRTLMVKGKDGRLLPRAAFTPALVYFIVSYNLAGTDDRIPKPLLYGFKTNLFDDERIKAQGDVIWIDPRYTGLRAYMYTMPDVYLCLDSRQEQGTGWDWLEVDPPTFKEKRFPPDGENPNKVVIKGDRLVTEGQTRKKTVH